MYENEPDEIDDDGNKLWRNDKGQIHRLDGPAIEWVYGTKEWWINGQLHRLDGPAIEYTDGSKHWYLNDKRHRLDGPAIEDADGYKEWFINGVDVNDIKDLYSLYSKMNKGKHMSDLNDVIISTLPPEEVMKNLSEITSQIRAKLNVLNDLKRKIDEEKVALAEPEITALPESFDTFPEKEDIIDTQTKLSLSELKEAVDILEIIANIESTSGKASICETSEKIRRKLNEILDR